MPNRYRTARKTRPMRAWLVYFTDGSSREVQAVSNTIAADAAKMSEPAKRVSQVRPA